MLQNYAGLEPYTEDTIADGIAIFCNDTLLANIRPYLKKVWKSEFDGACSTDVLAFSPEQIEPGFLYSIIAQDSFIDYVMSGAKGSKMPRGDKGHIMDFVTHLPTEAEQGKISSFIELINKRIALQDQHVKHLKKYKRGMISSILSGEIHIPGVSQHLWEKKPLESLFTISAGGDIEKEHCSPTRTEKYRYPVYANALANDGLYGYADYYKLCEKTITVTGRGEVGHATSRYEKYVPIVRLLALVPREQLDIEFFTFYINQTNIFIESTGVPQLTSPQLGKLMVSVPTFEEQKKISSIVKGIEHKISAEKKYEELLKEMRKALLQQLFI